MKLKDTKFHIIYSIFTLVFIISSGYISNKLLINAQKNFQPFLLYRAFFTVLFLFGVILGLEYLFNEKKKDGKWNLNSLKLTILGGTSLLVIIWHWFPIVFKIVVIKVPFPSIINHSMLYNLSVILFGWVLTTSIYKNDLNES